MNRYTRTDLAAELDLGDRHDVSETTERFGEVKASTIEIRTEGAAKRLGKRAANISRLTSAKSGWRPTLISKRRSMSPRTSWRSCHVSSAVICPSAY